MLGTRAVAREHRDDVHEALPDLADEVVGLEHGVLIPADLTRDVDDAAAGRYAVRIPDGLRPSLRLQRLPISPGRRDQGGAAFISSRDNQLLHLDGFAAIGAGWRPVIIFLGVAFIFHIALRYTRYGKFTYAIGANPLAARVSGINVERHLVAVYTIAGLLSGLSGIVHTARAISGQAGVGMGFELDAIAAAVIGGTSLAGGVGRMTGTVIGAVILGILTSGFTFLNVDAHYQEIIKGMVIIAAVITDQYRQRRRRSA